MSEYNPNWIKFDGTPVTGQVPTQVFASGPMTEAQAAAVSHVYGAFCQDKLLSIANTHRQEYRLADGTLIEITSIFGVDTITVVPSADAAAAEAAKRVFDTGIYVQLTLPDEKVISVLLTPVIPKDYQGAPTATGKWKVKLNWQKRGGEQLWVNEARDFWFASKLPPTIDFLGSAGLGSNVVIPEGVARWAGAYTAPVVTGLWITPWRASTGDLWSLTYDRDGAVIAWSSTEANGEKIADPSGFFESPYGEVRRLDFRLENYYLHHGRNIQYKGMSPHPSGDKACILYYDLASRNDPANPFSRIKRPFPYLREYQFGTGVTASLQRLFDGGVHQSNISALTHLQQFAEAVPTNINSGGWDYLGAAASTSFTYRATNTSDMIVLAYYHPADGRLLVERDIRDDITEWSGSANATGTEGVGGRWDGAYTTNTRRKQTHVFGNGASLVTLLEYIESSDEFYGANGYSSYGWRLGGEHGVIGGRGVPVATSASHYRLFRKVIAYDAYHDFLIYVESERSASGGGTPVATPDYDGNGYVYRYTYDASDSFSVTQDTARVVATLKGREVFSYVVPAVPAGTSKVAHATAQSINDMGADDFFYRIETDLFESIPLDVFQLYEGAIDVSGTFDRGVVYDLASGQVTGLEESNTNTMIDRDRSLLFYYDGGSSTSYPSDSLHEFVYAYLARDPRTLALVVSLRFRGKAFRSTAEDKEWVWAIDDTGFKPIQQVLREISADNKAAADAGLGDITDATVVKANLIQSI